MWTVIHCSIEVTTSANKGIFLIFEMISELFSPFCNVNKSGKYMDCEHSILVQAVTGQNSQCQVKARWLLSITMTDINCFQLKRLYLEKANCLVLGGEKTNCVLKHPLGK